MVKNNVNMLFAHDLENCLSPAFIFHTLIGLSEITSTDAFKFTRSTVKVTWFIFVINYVNTFF